jgi:hypothetical protein
MRITIDVTHAKPQVIFEKLAKNPDCAITVYPAFWKHVTLHMQDATVSSILAAVCEQIDCKYTFDGKHLSISHQNFIDKLRMQARLREDQAREAWFEKFKVHLPESMHFEDAKVSCVLAEISKVSGLEISPWEGEGESKVTLDISDMTVNEALKAIVLFIDGNGAVKVKSWNGGTTEYRLVDRP